MAQVSGIRSVRFGPTCSKEREFESRSCHAFDGFGLLGMSKTLVMFYLDFLKRSWLSCFAGF